MVSLFAAFGFDSNMSACAPSLLILAGLAMGVRGQIRPEGWLRGSLQRLGRLATRVSKTNWRQLARQGLRQTRRRIATRGGLLALAVLTVMLLLIAYWWMAAPDAEVMEVELVHSPVATETADSSGNPLLAAGQVERGSWDRVTSHRQRNGLLIMGGFFALVVLLIAICARQKAKPRRIA